MKKLILLSLTIFMFSANAYSQMQKGDKSFNFQASISSASGNTVGFIDGAFGYSLSNHWRIIAGPTIQIQSEETYDVNTGQVSNGVKVHVGLSLDGEYYFSTKSKLSPFLTDGIYFPDFSMSAVAELIGGGANYFITKNISWRNSLKIGIEFVSVDVPATEYTNATTSSSSAFLVLFQTGLEFKF